jgi:hypothetical protein
VLFFGEVATSTPFDSWLNRSVPVVPRTASGVVFSEAEDYSP